MTLASASSPRSCFLAVLLACSLSRHLCLLPQFMRKIQFPLTNPDPNPNLDLNPRHMKDSQIRGPQRVPCAMCIGSARTGAKTGADLSKNECCAHERKPGLSFSQNLYYDGHHWNYVYFNNKVWRRVGVNPSVLYDAPLFSLGTHSLHVTELSENAPRVVV